MKELAEIDARFFHGLLTVVPRKIIARLPSFVFKLTILVQNGRETPCPSTLPRTSPTSPPTISRQSTPMCDEIFETYFETVKLLSPRAKKYLFLMYYTSFSNMTYRGLNETRKERIRRKLRQLWLQPKYLMKGRRWQRRLMLTIAYGWQICSSNDEMKKSAIRDQWRTTLIKCTAFLLEDATNLTSQRAIDIVHSLSCSLEMCVNFSPTTYRLETWTWWNLWRPLKKDSDRRAS